ncbi:MAG: hypothetical protein JO041_01455 [Acidobacteria bacterium]|nr:hypothetical protein [Acidobacteriota bacterium]
MISDTSPQAAEVHLEWFRRMTPAQRLEMALEMSEEVRGLALAGLRSRRPELTANELKRELIRLMYGLEIQRDSWQVTSPAGASN